MHVGRILAPCGPSISLGQGQLQFLTSGQGQKVTYLGHVAYFSICLDKRHILKPTPGLYLNPIKSYKRKRTLTS